MHVSSNYEQNQSQYNIKKHPKNSLKGENKRTKAPLVKRSTRGERAIKRLLDDTGFDRIGLEMVKI
jgi:hypothetical protein